MTLKATPELPEDNVHVSRGMVEPGQCLWVKRPFDERRIHGFVMVLSHRCDPLTWNLRNFDPGDQASTLAWAIDAHRKLLNEEGFGLDRVIFAVGPIGRGFPMGVPFRVPGECMACDKHFEKWFGWKRDLLFLPR